MPRYRVLPSFLPPPKHCVLQSLKSLLFSSCCRLGSHQIDSAAPVPPSPVGTWVLLPPCKPWRAPSSSSSSPATHGPVCWCCCLATTLWWTAWREAMIKQPELASESSGRYCNVTSSDSWDSNTFGVWFLKKPKTNKHTRKVLHTPVCVGVRVLMPSPDAEGWGKACVRLLMKGEHNPNNCHDEQASPRANAACIDAVKHLSYSGRPRQQFNGMLQVLAGGGCLASTPALTASRNTLCIERNELKLRRERGGPAGSPCHFSSCLPDGQDQYRHKDAGWTQRWWGMHVAVPPQCLV